MKAKSKTAWFLGLAAAGAAMLFAFPAHAQFDDSGSSGSSGSSGTTGSTGSTSTSGGTETAPKYTEFGTNKLASLDLTNTMNFRECHEYHASISMKICILLGSGSFQCSKQPPIRCVPSYKGDFDYWEPSELIEVSCRKGFSMLLPNGVGQIPRDQSCFGQQGAKAQRWFFDARVWAINGDKGAAREQSAGSTLRKQATVCGLNGPAGGIDKPKGYAKKFDMFSKGGGSGPGQSWDAYISDYDATWAVDGAGTAAQPNPQPFQPCTGIDVNNCWGNLQPLSGWAVHPHRPVAAALIGWRAHTKAAGKVSPALSGGYKLEMDYPYVMSNSVYGQSQGLKGGGVGGGTKGSRCFQPGDPGPWWFTNQQENTLPEQIPAKVNELHQGDTRLSADLHTGTYIFTVWVKTACTLYAGVDGSNVQNAINGCRDEQKY